MRAIDADRLLTDRMKEHYYHLPNGDIAIPIIDIEHAPTITPERKTGKWIFLGDGYKCNKCRSVYSWWADSQTSNYCPNCGADMRGEQE